MAARLGVVLLLPRHASTEIDGLRRALGVSPIERVPPHITLVPPINVAHDDLDNSVALVRRVASERAAKLHVVVGPVDTFHPVTPVIYLRVSGPGLDTIRALRDALDTGALAHELSHEYVPHVTLNDLATPEQIDGALASINHYIEPIALDGMTVLEQGDDKVWRPIADAPFGNEPVTRTIGADAVTIAVNEHQSEAASHVGRYRALVVEAFVDGRTVGIARGRVADGDVAWLDELVVVGEQRGSGVGGALIRAFIAAARAGAATELRAARGATIGGFLERVGFAQAATKDFVLGL
ncbi:MAG: GNAT family N-acetyltransferase [Actinobacteria bacterium]|nr:GNAT family N-acetyltransferase [Actinomycetota bacterium]